MAKAPMDDAETLDQPDPMETAALLGPTPATYSYNDALLMGRMTPGELAKVRSELFGEEIEPEPPNSVPPAPNAPRSIPPPLPPEATQASRSKPPPLPAEARRSVPPPLPPAASRPPPAASRPPPPPAASRPPPPPAASRPPPPAEAKLAPRPKPPPLPPKTKPQQIKALIDAHDYAGALSLAERELLATPESAELQRYAEACRAILARAYLANLGRRSDVPKIIMGGADLRALGLDRWAAFVMSRVDGDSSIDDIVDISGMLELDTLRILYELLEKRVIRVAPRR
jgi:hypothetical protein